MRRRAVFALTCFVACAQLAVSLCLAPASYADSGQPSDAAAIQQKVQEIIDWLDSPNYARTVPWAQHVVLAYRLAQGRDPTAVEFFLLSALQGEIGLSRSAVLSIALRARQPAPTWAQCRDLVMRVRSSDFRADGSVAEAARRLTDTPPEEIRLALEALASALPDEFSLPSPKPAGPGAQYSTYFGYLHAHSALSDGQGTPLEAYTYARDVGHLDFFALTDHGELLLLWPWDHKWQQLVGAAEATYQPGSFVSLWGFEWSNPVLGHVNVINSADFTQSISNFSLYSLYRWLIARPGAFGTFNHPGDYNWLGIEFLHLKRYDPVVPQMVGIENWNQQQSFDRYYYSGSWASSFSFWDVGNRKGWSLGSLGGQDNHALDWGTLNDYRTAVLAESLTRGQIVGAYQNRRFYATEDKDLLLDLRCQGYPMGSHLVDAPPEFQVSGCDGSGDSFQQVRLYRNGRLLEDQAVSGTCFQTVLSDPHGPVPAYYYVIVTLGVDQDGNGRNDEAISSPIWIQ